MPLSQHRGTSVFQIEWRALVFRRCVLPPHVGRMAHDASIQARFCDPHLVLRCFLIFAHLTKFVEPFVVIVVQHANFHPFISWHVCSLSLAAPAARMSAARSYFPCLLQPMTNSQVLASCLWQLVCRVSLVSLALHSADRAARSCAVGKQHRGSCLQRCPSDIAHSPMSVRTFVPGPPSHRAFESVWSVVRLRWPSYPCPRLLCPQTAVEAQAAPPVGVAEVSSTGLAFSEGGGLTR